jgi:hypothetical protein
MTTLTAERLREILAYDPTTGIFVWKSRPLGLKGRNNKNAGRNAGYSCERGYINIKVDQRLYLAHRLAWLYVHGRLPVAEIDHRNGDKSDNRIENLREASRQQNAFNRGVPANNKVGLKGVKRKKRYRGWIATIGVSGRQIHLGTFPTKEAAASAYAEAARRYHGEFARTG